jgi:hypothetical protein
MHDHTTLAERLQSTGFAFLRAAETRALLGPLADWDRFAASWDDLGADTYMADGGRYRRRRFAAFSARDGAITRKPHQPHYQSRDYNPLNGGIERWFQPILPEIAAGDSLTAVLRFCRDLFEQLSAVRAWHIELHQFRIEARTDEAGKPTPEGMHRDGVDFVLVLMVRRHNLTEGVTTVLDLAGRQLGSFTLTDPLDAAVVDDNRVMHGVTPVVPADTAQPAFRDVLVVTFRRE